MKKMEFVSTRVAAGVALSFALLFTLSPGAKADTPLEKSFEILEKAFNKLRAGLKAPVEADKDKYVALATIMKTETQVCMGLEPKMKLTLPPDQQEAFLTNYRADMVKFDANVDKLLETLKAGDWNGALAVVELLRHDKGHGHKTYRVKDYKKG